jgi:riboflavin synthase
VQFDVVPETLDRTNLGALEPGNRVNLEPSLRLGEALGGHIVYGHVDATTRIETKVAEGPGARIRCAVPRGVAPMIVEKGFIALDGVSLTVARVGDGWFEVALVPETLARTTFGRKGAGANLNLEADPIARYVAAMLADRK